MIKKLKIITALYIVVLTLLAVVPSPTTGETFSFSDKIEHFFAFLILTVLFLSSFRNKMFLIVYPAFHESLQLFTSWRVFDFGDLFVNFIGVICGYVFYVKRQKKIKDL